MHWFAYRILFGLTLLYDHTNHDMRFFYGDLGIIRRSTVLTFGDAGGLLFAAGGNM